MKPLTRDIQFTLIIKFALLIVLWVICFKGAERNTTSMQQWLYGSSVKSAGTDSITSIKQFDSIKK